MSIETPKQELLTLDIESNPRVKNFFSQFDPEESAEFLASLHPEDIADLTEWITSGDKTKIDQAIWKLKAKKHERAGYAVGAMRFDSESTDVATRTRGMNALAAFNAETY